MNIWLAILVNTATVERSLVNEAIVKKAAKSSFCNISLPQIMRIAKRTEINFEEILDILDN